MRVENIKPQSVKYANILFLFKQRFGYRIAARFFFALNTMLYCVQKKAFGKR